MLATLSLGFTLGFALQPTPATTRLTAHDKRVPPPVAMLTRDAAAPRRLPRICLTPEAVRAATPPYAAARVSRLQIERCSSHSRAPCVRRLGTKYRSVVELPVIGEQHFGLSITSDREAQLTLQGAIDLDEPIYYNVGSDGKLEFTLSETTTRTLGRLGTTLLHAGARPASRLAHLPHDTLRRLALPPPCARADTSTCQSSQSTSRRTTPRRSRSRLRSACRLCG